MLVLTFAFGCALVSLLRGGWTWDARLEAAIEAGVVLSALVCIQGSIWARPTWGVWWDWDPRLTTTAVLLFAFGGILALRQFVDDPVKRAVWSAVAVVIAYVDVPLVYFSVRWWNSLHQVQSTPADRVAGVPLAAAHQRLRRAVPADRARRAARPARLLAPRGGEPRRRSPSAVRTAAAGGDADDRGDHGRLGVRHRGLRRERRYTAGVCLLSLWRYRRRTSRREPPSSHRSLPPTGALLWGTKRRRLTLVALAVAAVAILALSLGGIGQNLVYYWGPTELQAAGDKAIGATIRLGGLVADGSIRRGPGASGVEFDVVDRAGAAHARQVQRRAAPDVPRADRRRGGGHARARRPLPGPPPDGLPRQRVPRPDEAESAAIDQLMRSVREGDGRTGGPAPAASPPQAAAVTAAIGRNLVLLALLVVDGRRGRGRRDRRAALRRGLGLDAPPGLSLRGLDDRRQPADGVRAAGPRLQRELRGPGGLALGAELGRGREPVVLARGVDPVLGPRDRRLRRRRHLGEPGPASRVHAVGGRRVARVRRLLRLPARGSGAAVPDGLPGARRRARAEPAAPEPPADGDSPALPLPGLRRHDHPLRPRLARRCSRAAWATTSCARSGPG